MSVCSTLITEIRALITVTARNRRSHHTFLHTQSYTTSTYRWPRNGCYTLQPYTDGHTRHAVHNCLVLVAIHRPPLSCRHSQAATQAAHHRPPITGRHSQAAILGIHAHVTTHRRLYTAAMHRPPYAGGRTRWSYIGICTEPISHISRHKWLHTGGHALLITYSDYIKGPLFHFTVVRLKLQFTRRQLSLSVCEAVA